MVEQHTYSECRLDKEFGCRTGLWHCDNCVNNPKHGVATLRAQLAEREADAELGRLIREMPAGTSIYREYGLEGDDGFTTGGEYNVSHDHEEWDYHRELRTALGQEGE